MVATAGGVAWMMTSSAFRLGAPDGDVNLSYTPNSEQILAAAGLEPGAHPNVVLLRTDQMRNEH